MVRDDTGAPGGILVAAAGGPVAECHGIAGMLLLLAQRHVVLSRVLHGSQFQARIHKVDPYLTPPHQSAPRGGAASGCSGGTRPGTICPGTSKLAC
jgi:hypothetical protein